MDSDYITIIHSDSIMIIYAKPIAEIDGEGVREEEKGERAE